MSSRKRLEEESLSEDDGIFGENGEEEVIDENGSDESGSESEQQSSEESEAQETGDEGTAKEKPRRKMVIHRIFYSSLTCAAIESEEECEKGKEKFLCRY